MTGHFELGCHQVHVHCTLSILDRAENLTELEKLIYGKSHKFGRYAKKTGGGSRGIKRRNSNVGFKKCM